MEATTLPKLIDDLRDEDHSVQFLRLLLDLISGSLVFVRSRGIVGVFFYDLYSLASRPFSNHNFLSILSILIWFFRVYRKIDDVFFILDSVFLRYLRLICNIDEWRVDTSKRHN